MVSKLDGKYDDPEDIKKAREAAKKKGSKTFTVDGLRYDTATGARKPLSAAPSLEATQRRIDYEKARDKKPAAAKKASGMGGMLMPGMTSAKMPKIKGAEGIDKKGVYQKGGSVKPKGMKRGGKVRGAGIARKGVRPAKMR